MERAIRHSRKRDAILDAIRSTTCHPSADWVYQTLKPTHPDLSLGTVYRNLDFFKQHGMVKSVGVVRGQERFDGNTSPHTHFVCDQCGDVLDLHDIQPDPKLENTVSQQYQLHVHRRELTFYGLCPTCMQHHNHI